MSDSPRWDYAGMVSRQAGFVSAGEQARLRATHIFVCGVGGMGGIAAQALVRAGVGRLTIADDDTFEQSNLNRQVYADTGTLGASKTAVTAAKLRAINPDVGLDVYDAQWTAQLDTILATCPLVINTMDDLAAGVHLYRRAAVVGATVIDAYTSPLPNVTVVRARDARPEARLRFPTLGTLWEAITPAQRNQCRTAELEYVLVHSSSLDHIDHDVAAEVMAGTRARPSFAPVVWLSGTLMALEALQCAMGRPSGVDHRGLFFNPWTWRVERPRSPLVAALRRAKIRAALRQLAIRP